MDKSINEAMLDLALADLANQRPPNYIVTAKLYQVNRTTLRRRFLGTQQERSTSRVDSHQRLSEAQEETLIGFINSLTDRSLPPTSQIVHNCAEELIGERLNKNWVSGFTRRHGTRLHASYLQTIDAKRVKADYIPSLERFYKLVCIIYTLY